MKRVFTSSNRESSTVMPMRPLEPHTLSVPSHQLLSFSAAICLKILLICFVLFSPVGFEGNLSLLDVFVPGVLIKWKSGFSGWVSKPASCQLLAGDLNKDSPDKLSDLPKVLFFGACLDVRTWTFGHGFSQKNTES